MTEAGRGFENGHKELYLKWIHLKGGMEPPVSPSMEVWKIK